MRCNTVRRLLTIALAIVPWVAGSAAYAAIISQWTFEAGTSGNPPSATGTDITGVSPATGPGTASGHHASSATTWDNPSGNGSTESMSSNNWAVDDYYQFQTSTTGLSDIGFWVDHISSNTGPRDFKLQYSLDGSLFTDTGNSYSVRPNASPAWSSGTYLPQDTYKFDLSTIAALDNQANLYLRIVSTSTVSANGGTVATGGTSRVDNVTVLDGIPEPTSVLLLAVAGLSVVGVRRSRRR